MAADCRNPDHAGQSRDYCAGCARDLEAELTALNDRYMRLLNDKSENQRRTYAAARAIAQLEVRGTIGRHYLPRVLNDLMGHVRPALYRATQVDPAMARRRMDRSRLLSLRTEAERALHDWDERTSSERVSADFAADPREAEITRLRQVITTAGQRFHREADGRYEDVLPGGCVCHGCELIRDMDTEGLPEEEPAS